MPGAYRGSAAGAIRRRHQSGPPGVPGGRRGDFKLSPLSLALNDKNAPSRALSLAVQAHGFDDMSTRVTVEAAPCAEPGYPSVQTVFSVAASTGGSASSSMSANTLRADARFSLADGVHKVLWQQRQKAGELALERALLFGVGALSARQTAGEVGDHMTWLGAGQNTLTADRCSNTGRSVGANNSV